MAGAEEADTTTIDLRRDAKPEVAAQVDPSVHTLGAVFGTASFPPDMPEELKAAILERAEQERQLAGDMVMGTPSNPLSLQAKAEKEEQTREEFAATWTALERQQEIERQNETAWLGSSHTYAGQTLSGEEWKRMMAWFDDAENVAAWEDAMMAETGQSRDEVRRTGGKMKRFYELMGKDAKGALTDKERDEFDRLNKDRDVKVGVQMQQQIQSLQRSQSAELSSRNEATLDGGQREKTASFASTFADDQGLGNPAPLSNAYRKAAVGETQPPAAPAVQTNLPPSQTVQVSPDNMFG